jgi:hypothetical protein
MFTAFRRVLLLALPLAIPLSACRKDRDERERGMLSGTVPDTAPLVLQEGDVLITNQDSSVDLAAVGDRVVMKFSERVATKIRSDLDTTKVESGNSIGASIERAVKRGVSKGIMRRVEVPIGDIDSVTYTGGRIRFAYRVKPGLSFENFKVDHNRPVLETFGANDAERFVQAVRRRQAR